MYKFRVREWLNFIFDKKKSKMFTTDFRDF